MEFPKPWPRYGIALRRGPVGTLRAAGMKGEIPGYGGWWGGGGRGSLWREEAEDVPIGEG